MRIAWSRKLIVWLSVAVAVIIVTVALLVAKDDAVYDFSAQRTLFEQEYESEQDVFISLSTEGTTLTQGQSAFYTFESDKQTVLNIAVRYTILHNGYHTSEFEIYVNGECKCECTLDALWQSETNEYVVDGYGNEILPSQIVYGDSVYAKLADKGGKSAAFCLFPFAEGENSVEFRQIAGGSISLDAVYIVSTEKYYSYEEYIESVPNSVPEAQAIEVEAEFYATKNDTMIVPQSSADVNVTPYDTYSSVLNTLGNISEGMQTVNYELEVKKSGIYQIALNYRVDNPNRTTFLTVRMDGDIPFGELLHYPLVPTSSFEMHALGADEEVFAFYLSQGSHTISLTVDGSMMSTQLQSINGVIQTLNDIYLNLKRIAGSADANREWDESDFPGTIEALNACLSELVEVKKSVKQINGSDVNFQAVIYIEAAQKAIEGLLEAPLTIPNKYAKISEGSGSIVQTLANAILDMNSTPIALDKIVVAPYGSETDLVLHGGFYRFWEGTKKFFRSFVTDYSTISDGENVIDVWVARSRQYVEIMQQMADESGFFESTGYKVNFSILADEGKLILSNAADISPDAVMGISSWLPYEMGIRGLTCDLTGFSDYGEVLDRFSEGALLSLIADGIGLGLPETQDFYLLYYRKDIMDTYGFSLPDTWTDVIAILPTLQRYGLNFYIPLSSNTSSKSIMTTAPFIYQFGGDLFAADGVSTLIDSENSINAIKFMTELYTLYGLPQQISNFFDSFRNGSLPMGISTFDTYIRLMTGAPEISGKWGVAVVPGVANGDGTVERWQMGSSSSVVLMDGGEELNSVGWELLKWWTSADVQTEFMNKMLSTYGKAYIWNSANLEAFSNSASFTQQQLDIVLAQWEWLREIPRVPGWYMVERELSNAWNSIVIDGKNTRAVIEDAATRVNKELTRKLTEFGYIENGIVVRKYTVTTFEEVAKWKK
ncbi:MAG: extracellular solute-binding protein [Clostridia bacterium]|nr:extracellular solute-binding protein [Clostridia bacterium]